MSLTFISSLSARECCINFALSISWSIFLSSSNIAHVNALFDNKMPAFLLCSPSTFAAECNSGCSCVGAARNSHAPIILFDSVAFRPHSLSCWAASYFEEVRRGEDFLSSSGYTASAWRSFCTTAEYINYCPSLSSPVFLLLLRPSPSPRRYRINFFCFLSRQVITPASRLLRALEVVRTACLALRAA